MKQQQPIVALRLSAFASLMAVLYSGAARADEPALNTVNINASYADDVGLLQADHGSPSTRYRVDREAMQLFDAPGGTNPYSALANLPGVKFTGADAYGLNNMQGGQKGLRVRGEISTHGVVGTVDGLALSGPGPGPGYLFLFDKENLAGITFAQGAVAADRAGLFNTSGAFDSALLWPRGEALREVSLGAGSDRYRRLFARIDTGQLSTGTALFLSGSTSSADKWRGYGQAPSGRQNVELGLSQTAGKLDVKLLYAHNNQAQNSYKALNYAQASDLGRYREADYGNNPASADYYGHNRQDFSSELLLAELEYALAPQTALVFKPFQASEEGYYLYAGGGATQLQKWLIDHKTYGASAELRTALAGANVKLGYAWTSAEPPGPPTTRKQYALNAAGNALFQQWSMLNNVVDRHDFSNWYASAEKRAGAWSMQGGLRYSSETLPGIEAYKAGAATAGASWDVSAAEALARAVKDPARSVGARSFGYWLPQAGVGYQFNPALELHGSLGRNIGAPTFDAFNQTPAGKIGTSQAYWDLLRPELSTALDVGLRLRHGALYLDPTLYWSRSRHKAVSVFSAASNTVWSQNVGNTRAQGAQLAAGWSPGRGLDLFGALSYSRSSFTEDVATLGGARLAVDGKQLPDVPTLMANLGGAWRVNGYTLAPVLHYVGARWATTNYTERVGGYSTLDLGLSYRQKNRLADWTVSLSVLNAFDHRYIGQISTSEVNTTANGAIYYPGAPRALAAKLSFNL